MDVLALDIGGTKVAAGVVGGTGRVHSFVVAPSEPQRGPADGLARLFELGRRAIAESGREIAAVDIGCGGPIDAEGGVLVSPPHLPGWLDVPVAAMASQAFDRPAFLENDGTAAAAAEHRFGGFAGGDGKPASDHADYAFVVPSTSTARVQEMHVLLLHLLLEPVDAWAADA